MSKNRKPVGAAKADAGLPIDTAQRMMEVLKKFPSYKQPGNLPDHLKIPRHMVKKVMVWYQRSKKAVEEPSVESIGQFASMSEKVAFVFRSKNWDKPETPPPPVTTKKESEVDDEILDHSDSSYESDDESDDDEDFKNLFGKAFEEGFKKQQSESDMDGLTDGFAQLGKAMVPMAKGLTQMMMPMLSMVMTKELMLPSYKAGAEAYIEFIAKNGKTMSPEELDKAKSQLALYEEIVKLYEEEKDDDSAEVKGQRQAKVLKLSQTANDLGTPPEEVTAASQAATQGKSFNPELSGGEAQECVLM